MSQTLLLVNSYIIVSERSGLECADEKSTWIADLLLRVFGNYYVQHSGMAAP